MTAVRADNHSNLATARRSSCDRNVSYCRPAELVAAFPHELGESRKTFHESGGNMD